MDPLIAISRIFCIGSMQHVDADTGKKGRSNPCAAWKGDDVEAEKGEDHIYVSPEDGANVEAEKGWIRDRKGQKIQKVLNTFLNGWMMQVCRNYCETTTIKK